MGLPKKRAWCGCNDAPSRNKPPAVEKIQEFKVSPRGRPRLEDLESISLTLHVPIEEPFEVTSPPLK
jgi:hypothetical protein